VVLLFSPARIVFRYDTEMGRADSKPLFSACLSTAHCLARPARPARPVDPARTDMPEPCLTVRAIIFGPR
jgi:hypothetical protein